ncbi:MAG: hypothetical protein KC800_25325 [Candidatus Eremiobacteraeota bacterium]|nr:hypothetical protein [Candidatus Eremiobacteraeota bacterium]
MTTSQVSGNKAKPFGGNRRLATGHAKAAILRSDIQKRLGEELGGFVWKVEMWPNWLSISVDKLGNDERGTLEGRRIAGEWADENQEKLQEMFSGVLGDKFGELSIMGRNMGPETPYGGCCRTGCGGCLNGKKDRLIDKLQTNVAEPVDRFDF